MSRIAMVRKMSRSERSFKDDWIMCLEKGSKEKTSAIARRSSSAHRLPRFKRNTSVDTRDWANLLREAM
jgi:hypothetical protein